MRSLSHTAPQSLNKNIHARFRQSPAFTLVELLVVIAIIGILAALMLPVLARAKEKANVTRVRAELYGIGLALEMYSTDNDGKLPPVRVNCNSDLLTHWCELPVELANEHYLPHRNQGGLEADLEDVFNPDHTYKYAAPGPQLRNGGPTAPYGAVGADEFSSRSQRQFRPILHQPQP